MTRYYCLSIQNTLNLNLIVVISNDVKSGIATIPGVYIVYPGIIPAISYQPSLKLAIIFFVRNNKK